MLTHPLEPYFYIIKLQFTGVCNMFLTFAHNIDYGYSLETPQWVRIYVSASSQLVLKAIRTQVHSYSFWSIRTHLVNSYSCGGRFILIWSIRTRVVVDSYSFWSIRTRVVVDSYSFWSIRTRVVVDSYSSGQFVLVWWSIRIHLVNSYSCGGRFVLILVSSYSYSCEYELTKPLSTNWPKYTFRYGFAPLVLISICQVRKYIILLFHFHLHSCKHL